MYFSLLARSCSIVTIPKSWKLHDTVLFWEISKRFLQTKKAQRVLKVLIAILTLRGFFPEKLKKIKILFPVNHSGKHCTNYKERLLIFFLLKKEDAIRN